MSGEHVRDEVSPPKRMLVVNADDFGLNASATRGILDAYDAGSVTSTTLMVNAPAVGLAVAAARERPGLAVGLHFNLTWGRPLCPPEDVPALVGDDGAFLDRGRLGKRLLLGGVPAAQIRSELDAQLAAFTAHGLELSHIDGHQHVQAFPRVFAAVAEACRARGVWMRVPWVGVESGGGVARRARRGLLRWLLAGSTRRWRDRVRWNDALTSIFDLGISERPLADEDYARLLSRADGYVVELMVHPVSDAAEMQGYTSIGGIAEAEGDYLRLAALRAVAERSGFSLTDYRRLRIGDRVGRGRKET